MRLCNECEGSKVHAKRSFRDQNQRSVRLIFVFRFIVFISSCSFSTFVVAFDHSQHLSAYVH